MDARLDFIVVAGGSGSRLGGTVAKQFLPIGPERKPMVVVTIERILAYPRVGRVVLVLPSEGWREARALFIDPHIPNRIAAVVGGGVRRQDSVTAGLGALVEGPGGTMREWVAVHDAARPLVTAEIIEITWAAARRSGIGAVACSRVADTIKRVDASGRILSTEDRDQLVRAETPQIFRTEILLEAYRRAAAEGVEATDDSQLVERLGMTVTAEVHLGRNLKVTTAGDFELVERWLADESRMAKRATRVND